jgi:hypothetical protein
MILFWKKVANENKINLKTYCWSRSKCWNDGSWKEKTSRS